ncbi:hypothetical protein GEMRC1_006785 [Eukaryota sp. GEM-RC1]
MYRYLVAYDFEAADDSELTVSKGQIVTSFQPLVEDEWILVTTTQLPSREGYVPGSFMVEAPSSSPSTRSPLMRSLKSSYSTISPLPTLTSISPTKLQNKDTNPLYSVASQFETLLHRFEKSHAQLCSQVRILDHLCSDL